MAHKIKLFEWIRRMYQIIGIYPTSKSNSIMFVNFVLLFGLLMGSLAYIVFESKRTADRAIGFSTAVLATTVILFYSTTMFEMTNTIRLIGRFEDFIEMSKSSCINLYGIRIFIPKKKNVQNRIE